MKAPKALKGWGSTPQDRRVHKKEKSARRSAPLFQSFVNGGGKKQRGKREKGSSLPHRTRETKKTGQSKDRGIKKKLNNHKKDVPHEVHHGRPQGVGETANRKNLIPDQKIGTVMGEGKTRKKPSTPVVDQKNG